MTSRNMTEVFILMRNNAIQNRNMYDERVSIHNRELTADFIAFRPLYSVN